MVEYILITCPPSVYYITVHSQYQKRPSSTCIIHSYNAHISVLQITMSDLELLPHMYAPLQLMFAEHCVEMELKAAQRQRTREKRQDSPSDVTRAATGTHTPKRSRDHSKEPTAHDTDDSTHATKRLRNADLSNNDSNSQTILTDDQDSNDDKKLRNPDNHSPSTSATDTQAKDESKDGCVSEDSVGNSAKASGS